MREVIFILIVLVVLLALTAIRYRKQIAGMIGLARMLKQAKQNVKQSSQIQGDAAKPNELVNCSKCDIWVPESKAVKFRDGFICSNICQNAKAAQVQKPAR